MVIFSVFDARCLKTGLNTVVVALIIKMVIGNIINITTSGRTNQFITTITIRTKIICGEFKNERKR